MNLTMRQNTGQSLLTRFLKRHAGAKSQHAGEYRKSRSCPP